jgi:nitroimidazol reductase NimA-like FMN-containing flavoprotein (pyridoxamine 5'-phosphate oxidase superfamily)
MTALPKPDEPALVAFLLRNHRAFLFCRDDDGHPIGYAMRSITYEPGRLYFATYTRSAKVRHLLADPEAVCVVLSEDRTSAAWPSWVSLRGSAEVYRPSPAEIEPMLARSSSEARVPQSVIAKVYDRLRSGRRSFIRLDVEEVRARG